MKLALKIKLEPEKGIAEAIDATAKAYTESYNRIIDSQWSTENRINKVGS